MTTRPQKPTAPRRRSGFWYGCLVAALVLSAVFGLLLVMLFSSPGEIVERATRSVGPQDPVEQAATQLTQAQARAVRGVSPTVQIQLSDADINAYLAEPRDELDLPSGLQDPRVAFGDGFIEGSVRTKVAFVPVRVRVTLVPEVVDGKLVLHVQKIKAGKVGLTGVMRGSLVNKLNEVIEQRLAQSGVELKSVQVRPGVLTVTGELTPAGRSGN